VNFTANFETTIIILYYNIRAGHCGVCRAGVPKSSSAANVELPTLKILQKPRCPRHRVYYIMKTRKSQWPVFFNHLFQGAESSASIPYWCSYTGNRTSGIPETRTTAECWPATRNWSWSRWTTGSAYWVSWTKKR